MMSPRENLISTLRRQGMERVPIDLSLCESQVATFEKKFGHRDYATHFGLSHRGVGIDMHPVENIRAWYREELPDSTTFDVWGVGHSKGSEAAFHMTRMHHPLRGERTVEEIRSWPLPRIKETAGEKLSAEVGRLHGRGLAAMGGMACTLWEIGWYLRSMDDLMDDMSNEDERAVVWLDRLTEHATERMRLYAKAGCDLVQLGDDIGMQHAPMMAVPFWEKWIKPRMARVIAAGREIKPDLLVFYHSCGFVVPFLDGLLETGIDILNPVQPECMAFPDVHARTRGRCSYWGTVGTQTTMPNGTPEEVRRVVRQNLDEVGNQGGLVVAPTHLVEPEVPWENIEALVDEARRYRAA
jgi:uroporphyrinogen decarboxylase